MDRRRTCDAPPSANRLPPFGAAGWLVTILSEPDRGPAIRPEADARPHAARAGTAASLPCTERMPERTAVFRVARALAAAFRQLTVRG